MGGGWLAKAAVSLLVIGVVVGVVRAAAEPGERSRPPANTAADGRPQGAKPAKKPAGAGSTKGKDGASTTGTGKPGAASKPDTKPKNQGTTGKPGTATKPRKSPAEVPSRTGYRFARGPNTSRHVVLSYDDCPTSRTAFHTVIDAAERLGIALMLFPTGQCLRAGLFSPAYARSHGHYVFNHSISHPDLARLSYQDVLRQLGAPGVQSYYGRPPFGSYNATVARAYAAKGMKIWTWSLDTNDWRGYSADVVVDWVVRHATPGGTVLMHMQWRGFTESAIERMKTGLATRGLGLCRNSHATTPVRSATVRC